MPWSGTITFGDMWAAYHGPIDENVLHAHAAAQLIRADVEGDGAAIVTDQDGQEYRGRYVMIRPLVRHSLHADGLLTIIYAEAQSQLAFDLLALAGPEPISMLPAVPSEVCASPALDIFGSQDALLASLERYNFDQGSLLDPRLTTALDALMAHPGEVAIADVVAHSGVSASRMRTLAREQLGMPISTWLIWHKMHLACIAVSRGASLADAAAEGGFSDQSHFTRAMRRMLGITPGDVEGALR